MATMSSQSHGVTRGRKKCKSSVTNLHEKPHAGAMRRMAAWRWGVEGTLQALKSGWPLGQGK